MADPQPGRGRAPVAPPTGLLGTADEIKARLDPSKVARYLAGQVGMTINQPIGVVQGAGETVKGLFDTAVFGARLLNPIDPLIHEEGDAAWDHVADAIGGAVDYGMRAHEDPSILRRDVGNGLRAFRASVDPTATPMADSLLGEYQRGEYLGRNQGKAAFDAASMVEGGLAFKGLAKIGAFRPLTRGDYVAAGFKARQIERLMEPYDGLGHHSVALRDTKDFPQWLRDNPFFTVRPSGITRGDMYQLHYGIDPRFYSARVPRERGGPRSWHGGRLSQERYDALNRYVFGTPVPVQQVAVANALGTTFKNYLPRFDYDAADQNHSSVRHQYSR